MKATNPQEILTQLGYYREDTAFVSLNLTDEQFVVLMLATEGRRIEEVITEALRQMMARKTGANHD